MLIQYYSISTLVKEMVIILNFIIGVFVGANISLFLYAIILSGKEKDHE